MAHPTSCPAVSYFHGSRRVECAPVRVAHLNTAKSWRGGEQQLLLLMRGLAVQAEAGVEQVLYAQPESPLGQRAAAAGFRTTSCSTCG